MSNRRVDISKQKAEIFWEKTEILMPITISVEAVEGYCLWYYGEDGTTIRATSECISTLSSLFPYGKIGDHLDLVYEGGCITVRIEYITATRDNNGVWFWVLGFSR